MTSHATQLSKFREEVAADPPKPSPLTGEDVLRELFKDFAAIYGNPDSAQAGLKVGP